MTRSCLPPPTITLACTLAFALISYLLLSSRLFAPSTTLPQPSTLDMAYGAIAVPETGELTLPILSYNLPNQKGLTTFPLTLESTPLELRETMYRIFAAEIESEHPCHQQHHLPGESIAFFAQPRR